MPIALVTGSARHLGRAIAECLAKAGYDLVLHAGHSREELEETRAHIQRMGRKTWAFMADLSQEEQQSILVKQVKEAVPQLDVLVHNAGIFEERPFEKVTYEEARRAMSVNCWAPLFITQGLLPLLKKAESASIVHIIDTVVEKPYKNFAHYIASKGALLALTKSLSVELAPQIRVNGVSPYVVPWPEYVSEEQAKVFKNKIPLGRVGEATDIAKVVLFLAKEATYVTGQVVNVNGGAV